ncbi:MAG: ParA family protein [Symploca sp. SIO3E6]|nr:ParA family protein [Caldora sp. SIO3E6]
MIISIVGYKGGVGKTTTAIHLAGYLQTKVPTLLVDSDKNRSALVWNREEKLPFKTVAIAAAGKWLGQYQHSVFDTAARPSPEELQDLAEASDLLLLPTPPKGLDLDALIKMVDLLQETEANFRILFTQVPPRSSAIKDARRNLEELKLPMFKAEIPKLVAFEKAPLAGVLIKDYPNRYSDRGWKAYQAVGREILKEFRI